MSAQLKPCPFCGGKPTMRERGGNERNGYNTDLELDCNCGASIATETQNNGGLPTETVAAAKRRLRAAWNTRAPQWQSIESAPRDGTLILLGRPGDEADDRLPISTPGRWFEGYEDGADYMGHDDGFMDTDFQKFSCPRTFGAESYRSSGFQPTHWQPLPAPPEVQP